MAISEKRKADYRKANRRKAGPSEAMVNKMANYRRNIALGTS